MIEGQNLTEGHRQRPAVKGDVVVVEHHLPGCVGHPEEGQAQQRRPAEIEALFPVGLEVLPDPGFGILLVAPVLDPTGQFRFAADDEEVRLPLGHRQAQQVVPVDDLLPGFSEALRIEGPFEAEAQLHLVGALGLQGVEQQPLLQGGQGEQILQLRIPFLQGVENLPRGLDQGEVGRGEGGRSVPAVVQHLQQRTMDRGLQPSHLVVVKNQ